LTQPERSDCARTSIVDWWRWREPSTRRKLLAPIREDLERLIGTDWRLWRHPAQTPPDGAWSSWLFLGGRGAGKTRAGAEWLAGRARPGARLALSGLLRALQGTETEMRAGAEAGATVVILDDALTRLNFRRDERGLPLEFRAGPAGVPPGGAGVTALIATCLGVHDRPWSPVHLSLTSDGGDISIRWTPRRRLYGDGWDGDRSLEPGQRFRLRFMDGMVVRRSMEVEGLQAVYSEADQAVDFPGGLAAASVEVSPWGEAWGWGPSTRLSMAV